MTTSVTGITAEKAALIEASSVVAASMTAGGELILTTHGGTSFNLGTINSDIRVPVMSIRTLKSFDKGLTDVLIPEFMTSGVFNSKLNLSLNPIVKPTSLVWSPDAQYFAFTKTVVAGSTATLYMYKRTNDMEFTLQTLPTSLPSNTPPNMAWSPEAKYLAMAPNSSGVLFIYERSADTLSKLSDDATNVADGSGRVAFSPNGQKLAVVQGAVSSNPLNLFNFVSGALTRQTLDQSGTRFQGLGKYLEWSNSGKYLVISYNKSGAAEVERLIAYKIDGTTYSILPNTTFSELPTGNVNDIAWSPDDRYLAVVSDVANTSEWGLRVYRRSGDNFTKLNTISQRPTNSGTTGSKSCRFSLDGRYLFVSDWQSGVFLRTYKIDRSNDSFTLIASTVVAPTSPFTDLKFSPDGVFLLSLTTANVLDIHVAAAPKDREGSELFQRVKLDQ